MKKNNGILFKKIGTFSGVIFSKFPGVSKREQFPERELLWRIEFF
jgi:hypothetical protein